jgi:flagellar FliJ protein
MKKRFRFKLQPVENVRRSKEQECMRVLALAQTRFQQALQFKIQLIQELEDSLIRREQLGQTATSVMAFLMENDFIAGQKQRIVQADQFILRAKKNVEKCLREFLIAKKDTRVIEKLRENAFAEFKQEIQKKEQKELEELYVMRARLIKESA